MLSTKLTGCCRGSTATIAVATVAAVAANLLFTKATAILLPAGAPYHLILHSNPAKKW